jgi:hypothetical protein
MTYDIEANRRAAQERLRREWEAERIARLQGRRRVLINVEHVCGDCGGTLKAQATRSEYGVRFRYSECKACGAEYFVVIKQS